MTRSDVAVHFAVVQKQLRQRAARRQPRLTKQKSVFTM